jgi:hypothetical protein
MRSTYSSTTGTVGSALANPPGPVVCCQAFANMNHAFRARKALCTRSDTLTLMFQQISVADRLISRLRSAGVGEVFGVPGDFSLAFMDVLEASPDISWVGCASELGAAYARNTAW